MDNTSDRKQIAAKEKALAIADRERQQTTAQIMSTTAGRKWVWEQLTACHLFHTTHVAGDPMASAFLEGERNSGLRLLSDLMSHCPDQFIQAMREANVRHISDDRSARNADAAHSDAERPSSPQPDGGDSGAEPDQAADAAESTDAGAESWRSPGKDIYVS